jgi:hypothetical protein
VPVTAHPGPVRGPVTKEGTLIDLTSLFSAVETQPCSPTAVSPLPTTNPFQAPDFGEEETSPLKDAQESASDKGAARPKAS